MMVKKYFALSLITAALTVAGCSSDDDDDNGDTGTVDAGTVDAGTVDAGTTDSGTTDGGTVTPVEDMSTMTGGSILDVARGTDDGAGNVVAGVDDLSTLVTLLSANNDLLNLLDDESGPMYTVFAPNNAALATATGTDGELEGADDAAVKNTLTYHVVAAAEGEAALNTSALTGAETFPLTLTTAQGATVDVQDDGTGQFQVVDSDGTAVAMGEAVVATNGVVYIIDTVLTSPAAPATDGGDTEGDTTGGGTDGTTGGGAAGTATAAIEGAANLSDYLAVLNQTSLNLSLQDAANDSFITIAPSNGNVDTAGADARDYLLARIINNAALGGVLVPGSYATTGNTTIEVGGTAAAPTINGVPLVVVAGPGTTGGAVYSLDGDV